MLRKKRSKCSEVSTVAVAAPCDNHRTRLWPRTRHGPGEPAAPGRAGALPAHGRTRGAASGCIAQHTFTLPHECSAIAHRRQRKTRRTAQFAAHTRHALRRRRRGWPGGPQRAPSAAAHLPRAPGSLHFCSGTGQNVCYFRCWVHLGCSAAACRAATGKPRSRTAALWGGCSSEHVVPGVRVLSPTNYSTLRCAA